MSTPSTSDPSSHFNMQQLQEFAFGTNRNYRVGSPHLAHHRLYDRLVALLFSAMRDTRSRGLPLSVLEIGAGHGGYTEPALAYGCHVTATEMSRASADRLRARFGANDRFSVVSDEDGSLSVIKGDQFSIIICASVLHHIPDYLGFLEGVVTRHLVSGGTFLSIQDPLWYPKLPSSVRLISRIAFLSWRLTQGNYRTGINTMRRRVQGRYDPDMPGDMVEYHVVRQGLDEQAILSLLSPMFNSCSLTPYWSSQGSGWQRAGEVLGIKNTFAVAADGFAGGHFESEIDVH